MPNNNGNGRFNRANGQFIRELRKRRGWTQCELAQRAGYSERVIRKAEASETISHEVLDVLAVALSNPEHSLTAAELTFDPISIVRQFVDCYDRYGQAMLPHVASLFTEDTKLIFRADPERNPLAGEYHGLAGWQQYLDRFFGMFTRVTPKPLTPEYSASGNYVIARWLETVRCGDVTAPPLWVHLHFTLRGGKVALTEDYCDTDTAAKFLQDVGMAPKANPNAAGSNGAPAGGP